MRFPSFMYGTHASVTRACKKAAPRLIDGSLTFGELEGGGWVDIAEKNRRLLLIEPHNNDQNVLLYALPQAIAVGTGQERSFRRQMVLAAFERDWLLMSLLDPTWGHLVLGESSGPELIEFLKTVDRSWDRFIEIGPRFGALDGKALFQVTTTINVVLFLNGISTDEMKAPGMSMNGLRDLVRRVIALRSRAKSRVALCCFVGGKLGRDIAPSSARYTAIRRLRR